MKKYSMETTVGIFVVICLLCVAYLTLKLGDVSMLGDRFVKIDAGGGGGLLKPGGTITETEPPVDILELIGKYAFGDVEKKQAKENK